MRTMPFHSRDPFYKSIFGSIQAHRVFRLRVLLPRDGYVTGVTAVLDKDGTGKKFFKLTEDTETYEGGFHTFHCDLSLDEGLYFYHFLLHTTAGERRLLHCGNGYGDFDPKNGTPWQLTVYEETFETPTHTRGGIIYQIFPDRFYRGKISSSNIPADRFIRNDWGGIPAHTGDKNNPCRLGNDYFLGNLNGITEKLDYLSSLGVTMIYLNPIFEAHSNHRYNTADYFNIDPMLGTEKDFITLCKKAKKKGIDILLDGVFSHTGSDSRYFNAAQRYGKGGAYNDKDDPYFSWYRFRTFPDDYDSWWGIKTLPEVAENDPSFTKFITGKNGVIRHWMRKGAAGFRLDVADELPDAFLDKVRRAVKAENKEGYLLGEVWEDASNKISYSARRRFLRGRQLDSVMNYPFANAMIDFVTGGTGYHFAEAILTVLENYPEPALHNLMNHIGTHDTERILTRLGGEPCRGRDRDWQAMQTLSFAEYQTGKSRLKMAALLQYTLVGIPSLYYGDEVGMSGYGDPFCRGCYPWGKEDTDLLSYYRTLGKARRECPAFVDGTLEFLAVGLGYVVFRRQNKHGSAIIGVNRWNQPEQIFLSVDLSGYQTILGAPPTDGTLTLVGEGVVLLIENQNH